MPRNLNRLLLIVDCLIKNFRILGYGFTEDSDGFILTHNEERLYLSFREKGNYIQEEDRKYSYQSWVPNGKLSVKIKYIYDKEFFDNSVLLENQIEKILIYIAIKFNTLRIEHERSKDQRRLNDIEKRNKKKLNKGKRTSCTSLNCL